MCTKYKEENTTNKNANKKGAKALSSKSIVGAFDRYGVIMYWQVE